MDHSHVSIWEFKKDDTRAEQLIEILSKLQYGRLQYPNRSRFHFLIMSQHTIINEALWCYRDALAYKSYSPDVREHACLVQISSSFLDFFQWKWKKKVYISVKIITIEVCCILFSPILHNRRCLIYKSESQISKDRSLSTYGWKFLGLNTYVQVIDTYSCF